MGYLFGFVGILIVLVVTTVPAFIVAFLKKQKEQKQVSNLGRDLDEYKARIESEIDKAYETNSKLVQITVSCSAHINVLMEQLKNHLEMKRYNYEILQETNGTLIKIFIE